MLCVQTIYIKQVFAKFTDVAMQFSPHFDIDFLILSRIHLMQVQNLLLCHFVSLHLQLSTILPSNCSSNCILVLRLLCSSCDGWNNPFVFFDSATAFTSTIFIFLKSEVASCHSSSSPVADEDWLTWLLEENGGRLWSHCCCCPDDFFQFLWPSTLQQTCQIKENKCWADSLLPCHLNLAFPGGGGVSKGFQVCHFQAAITKAKKLLLWVPETVNWDKATLYSAFIDFHIDLSFFQSWPTIFEDWCDAGN